MTEQKSYEETNDPEERRKLRELAVGIVDFATDSAGCKDDGLLMSACVLLATYMAVHYSLSREEFNSIVDKDFQVWEEKKEGDHAGGVGPGATSSGSGLSG